MPVRLIALDIDGTLLDSSWKLPDANRTAIAEATRRGIEVALVTGRRYEFAMPIARQVGAPLTMIVSNGAEIRPPKGKPRSPHRLRLLPPQRRIFQPILPVGKLPYRRSYSSDALRQSSADARSRSCSSQ